MKALGRLAAALAVSGALHLAFYVALRTGTEPGAPASTGPQVPVRVEVWAPLSPVRRPNAPTPPKRARGRTENRGGGSNSAPSAAPVLSAVAVPAMSGGASTDAGEVRGGVQGLGMKGGTLTGSGAGEAAGEEALRALSARLAEAARACYPPAARRLRLVGQVELLFCVEPDGSASRVTLGGSTGSPVLDRAAEDCVLQGAVPLPVREGCFRLPVRFGVP